jgi:low temperature requirement protein LtrA
MGRTVGLVRSPGVGGSPKSASVAGLSTSARTSRLAPVLRQSSRVSPLELFFDLVFVLALTQCTAAMADDPSWEGLARAMLILALLWWSWSGYVWLTGTVDPEEGAARLVIFASMAAFLVAALCVPEAFDESALLFACAYATVRVAHLGLYAVASRDDPQLRRSVTMLALSSSVGVALIFGAAFLDGTAQGALWVAAIAFDYGGPYFFGVEGWRIFPGHFAERFGLIVIIALGESIVAVGAGLEGDVDALVVIAAVLATVIAAALWWLYFDVVALVAERRLAAATPGREQNAIAQHSYAYLHLPMVAGVILIALGLKKTVGDADEALKDVPAAALLGGAALYLLAHVAFRWRNVHSIAWHRLACAIVLLALIPVATEVDALVAVAFVAGLLVALIVYEATRFAEARDRVRHELAHEPGPPD